MKTMKQRFLEMILAAVACASAGFTQISSAEPKSPAKPVDKDGVPDFTAGDKLPPGTKCDFNLGPTGMRGWAWTTKEMPVRGKARQILVTVVEANSPADGKILKDDVILGVSGKPFDTDARVAFGDAITKAEETEQKGALDLLVWRQGKTSNVTLSLAVMGSYSATAPYNCPKSKKILENGYAFLAKKGCGGGIDGSVNALALLNSGDPKYFPVVTPTVEGACVITSKSLHSWYYAYGNLLACEYYLATKDQSILPSIQRLTSELVTGQSLAGTWGHAFATKEGLASGYGAMNQVGLPATISLLLARETGIEVTGLDEAIDRSARFLRFYVDKGSIPYGDHLPYPLRHDDNGKSAGGAVLFDLLADAPAARFFARLSTAGYLDRQNGHTGHYFNFFWGPLGSFRSGPEAFQAHFRQIRWYLELARKADGRFVYQPNIGVWDGAHEHKYAGWDCTGAHLLTYAAPNQKIHITGKKGISAAPLTGEELAETMKAGELITSEYDNLPVETLMRNLQSWSPVVGIKSADALAKKEGDVVPGLIAILKGTNRNARFAVCEAFEAMGRAANSKTASASVKARAAAGVDQLAKLFDDPDPYTRVLASKALAAIGDPSRRVASLALTRMHQKDASDPTGMLKKYSFNDWFEKEGHPYLLGKSLDGIDPENAEILKNKAIMLEVFSRNHIKEGLDRCLKGVKAGDAWSMSLVLPYIGNYGSSASEALPYLEKLINDAAGKKAKPNAKKDKASSQLESAYDKIKNGKPVELISLADYLEKQSKQGSK